MPAVSARDDAGWGGTPFGISLGLGAVAMVVATIVAGAMFPELPARLVLVALAVAGCAAAGDRAWAAVATAAVGYPLFDGFLVNRDGELTWDGTTSLGHVAVFCVAVGLGLAWRWVRVVRAEAARDDELAQLLANTESIETETYGG